MSDTAVAQGIGAETINIGALLITLLRQVSGMEATLKIVADGQVELSRNTAQQLTLLQERVGKSETLNEVQNEKIAAGEQSERALRADILEMKAVHNREIQELEKRHNIEMQELRAELNESSRMRLMVRGGLAVLAVAWPILWNLVVLPMFGR